MKHKSIRTALGLSLLAMAFSAHAGASGKAAAAQDAKTEKADSLNSLRVLLSSEVKTGNEVLIPKNPRLADSLLRNSPQREAFLRDLRDSSLFHPIRGPREFGVYWDRIEKENGIPALKSQMAAHDVDKGLIPKAYLFDSSVVVYPGWIIVRRKLHR